jgi:anti-sigma factor RsiW
MTERTNSSTCERASDLIAFIYNEADEREKQDFRMHLSECASCRAEAASFGVVRESITAWRDEALAGFVSTPVAAPQTNRKSALAALRQFFDLSPLWLKGATAFAVLTFCVLLGIVIFKGNKPEVQVTQRNPNVIYTEQDVNRIVTEALAKVEEGKKESVETSSEKGRTVKYAKPKSSRPKSSNQFAKSRRPLSRAEREQLAADLRLLSTGDDEPIHLLGDRINQ